MIWTMRVLTVCFVLLSAFAAQAQSAKEMLGACEVLQRAMHREGSIVPERADMNRCWGFMEAVQEYAVLLDRNGKTLLNACPLSYTTTADIVKVFIQYARAHPEKLYQNAAAIAYDAMADAFPCK